MHNTNFQTFHQMGAAINDLVKQATGRENVQNIDMKHVTVAQNRRYVEVEYSGSMVSFNAGAAGLPLEKCLVQIKPVQAGSGDPSPENVRPISGWDGVNIVVSPTTDAADGRTYSIAFPSEAGTVYGGTLDAVSGELVVDRKRIVLDGTQLIGFSNWQPTEGTSAWLYPPSVTPGRINTVGKIGAISDSLDEIHYGHSDAPTGESYIYNGGIGFSSVGSDAYGLVMRVPVSGLTNNSLINAYLAEHPITIVYPLTEPVIYNIAHTEIRTLLGQNNIWADTGDITVKFTDLTELY